MKVSSVDEMRRLDARAIDEFRVPDHLLMENAGQAVYYAILHRLTVRRRRFAVLAGPGNNGGDGFVAARKLRSTGGDVCVLVLADPAGYAGAARLNYEMLVRSHAHILIDPDVGEIAGSLRWCDVVVDGLLGTGITRDVGGPFREAIERVNESGRPVFAIDIPSGVDGDTGQVRGAAIRAQTTVTFGLPKRGNLLYPGADLGGRLVLSHISFPPELRTAPGIPVAVSEPSVLPESSGHVGGDREEVLVVAGAPDDAGAVELAAASLVGAGCRRCRLAAPRSVAPRTGSLSGETMVAHQVETAPGEPAPSAVDEIGRLGHGTGVVVLALAPAGRATPAVARRLVSSLPRPLVLSGDAVVAVPGGRDSLRRRTEPTLLALSPDELARIAGRTVAGLCADPIPAVQDTAEDLHAILVLADRRTLIGLPDRRVYMDPCRHPGTADAGSRAVMAGTIAAAHGLGLPLEDAARTGVFLHGLAGELATRGRGGDGIQARDVLGHLPEAIEAYRRDFAGVTADYCGAVEVI